MDEARADWSNGYPTFTFDVGVRCRTCGETGRASLSEREATLVNTQTGQPYVHKHRWIDLPAGWRQAMLMPDARPILTANGLVDVDLRHDPPEKIANASQTPQSVWCCGTCAAKAARVDRRAVDVFREAGATVIGPDGKPIQ